MSRTRTLIIALALAAALPAALAHLTGCEKTPAEPAYDNPFDPDGPLGGDGLQVRAVTGQNVITVTWDHHRGRDITTYILDHRTDRETEWTTLVDTLLEDDDVATVQYFHTRPAPNRTHYYLVQALTTDGEYSLTGYATPAQASTPPLVLHDAFRGKAPSRYVNFRIVTGEGDSVRVADNGAFTGALVVPAAADTTRVTWDYGPRADGDTLRVHVQSFSADGYASDVFSTRMTVEFEPTMGVVGGVSSGSGIKVPHVVNDLKIGARGVERMRFAADEGALAGAAWVAGDTLYPDYVLGPTTGLQSIWGEFEGDFGFNFTREIRVRADLLEAAGFVLDLPDNRVTTHTRVGILSNAAATQMRFSDDPDFPSNPDMTAWRPYAKSDSLDFTGTPGPVTIYGQFRNDWTDSGIYTDSLVFTLLPLDVYFVAPPADATIEGGTTYQITGRAVAADGALLTTVQVDKGDGLGFVGISLAQEWSTDWSVPVFETSREILLRAMATTATDTARTAIRVTVQPPAR